MIALLLQEVVPRGEINIWGVVIPASIFIIAFVMTMLLYRHFSKPLPASEDEQEASDPTAAA